MSDTSKIVITGVACLALGALAGNYLPIGNFGSAAGGVSEDRVRGIVAEYIANNPEHIIDSLQSLQRRSAVEQQAKTIGALKENLAALQSDENAPSVGTDESGITLVEFFDYHCGYCKRMSGTVQKVLKAHPDVKFVFREFPILSEDSHRASQAALAISYLAPERYLEYHMMLMQHQGEFSQQALNDYAGQVQVDLDAFQKEMNGERVAKELQQVQDLAAKVGIQGTPALVIGEELIPGAIPFNDLDARIKALKEQKDS